MATIFVEGLGEIQIQGEVPTREEQQTILNALETTSTDIENQYLDKIPDPTKEADVEKGLATDTAIPEMIDPNLAELGKPKGLEKIGGRPTFEAAGAIAGSVIGGAGLNPATAVAGGTLGSMGLGQLHDVLQAAITDEPTDFVTQVGKAKSDFQREATLQTFFAKVPGLLASTRKLIFGKPEKSLYDSAKRIGYPLSLSDSGNILSRAYGKVIGVFPYVGSPIKTKGLEKAAFLNKTADDTLNTFGPNVTLSKLGIDMSKAATSTFNDFRRVSGFFYDDFYKSVDKIGNTPVISTKNYVNSLQKYVKLIDSGKIKGVKSPQKDAIYKYAKQNTKSIPKYINATQYKSLAEDIKYYSKLAKKEPFNVKVLTGLKSSLETDLRLLTKESYQKDLLNNVYPMSKSKIKKLDPNLLSDIAEKLKFADKVYANGVQNSIISNVMKKEASKQGVKLTTIPGKKTFDSPVSKEFKKVDKNIFGPGFEVQGSINVDLLGEALVKRGASKALFADLRSLVGQKQFDKFTRAKIQKGFDDSLIPKSEGGSSAGLIFNPYKFEQNLGLNTETGRELLEEMLKGSKLKIGKLDDFFEVAKNHAGLKLPDVSSFMQRRLVLGGPKSLLGGMAMGATTYTSPFLGLSLIYMGRRTSNVLANPKILDDIMTVMNPNSTASQIKITSLKLIDGLISDSQNNIEKNELSSYREYIELLPTDKIRKELEEGIPAFTNDYLNESSKEETPTTNNTVGDQSALPQQNLPQTPNVNVASLQPNNTTMNQDYNNLSSLEKDKLLRGIS